MILTWQIIFEDLANKQLASPAVLGFSESKGKLTLNDVDGMIFINALDLWCGMKDYLEVELGEVQQLASESDQFQITDVTTVLEEALMGQLSMDLCGEVLMWSGRCGMRQLEAEALEMAARRSLQARRG